MDWVWAKVIELIKWKAMVTYVWFSEINEESERAMKSRIENGMKLKELNVTKHEFNVM